MLDNICPSCTLSLIRTFILSASILCLLCLQSWGQTVNTINPGSIEKGVLNPGPDCAPLNPNNIGSAPDASGSGDITYTWEQSTDNQASWQPASGSSSTSYRTFNPDPMIASTSIRRVATSTLNSEACSAYSNIIYYIVFPLPMVAPILPGGTTNVCINAQINLTNATPGGTWNTMNAAIASVSGGGIVSGLNAGTVTIRYTVTDANNCSKPANKTVHVLVPVLTFGSSVCVGRTMNLAPSTGGTWVSSDPAKATVTNTGEAAGVAIGTVTFTFTDSSSGCSATTSSVTVSPLPSLSEIYHY